MDRVVHVVRSSKRRWLFVCFWSGAGQSFGNGQTNHSRAMCNGSLGYLHAATTKHDEAHAPSARPGAGTVCFLSLSHNAQCVLYFARV